jgi:micrococcal nuclease
MNSLQQKWWKSTEGKKFLWFLVAVGVFCFSVALGLNQWSWQSFCSYVKQSGDALTVALPESLMINKWGMFSGESLGGNLSTDASTPENHAGLVLVKRVVDGDTIELKSDEKVRYVGVNAPESVKVNAPVECYGKIASKKNKDMVEGKWVRLEKDVSEKDRYGRLLRFVYLSDGSFVNDVLVRDGYARVSTFPPDVKLAEQFKLAEREARDAKRGLWADDTCAGKR